MVPAAQSPRGTAFMKSPECALLGCKTPTNKDLTYPGTCVPSRRLANNRRSSSVGPPPAVMVAILCVCPCVSRCRCELKGTPSVQVRGIVSALTVSGASSVGLFFSHPEVSE